MAKQSSQRTDASLLSIVKIPDIFSLFNAVAGLASIYFSIQNRMTTAAALLIIAVIFDVLDGRMAKMLGMQRDFGKQMDSLADIISFGVAPAVFGLQMINDTKLNYLILVFFVVCGIIRLARYNILAPQPHFIGLPITSSGYIIPIFYFAKLSFKYFPYVYLLLALLMISPLKFPKLFK